jgi:ABC-type phosphate transport system substrate-binding protein
MNVQSVRINGLTGLMAKKSASCFDMYNVNVCKRISASEKSFALSQVTLNGAGATLPFPLLDTWRVAYQKDHPNVNINYQSIGSGGGIKKFTVKTVDFGASDAPLNAGERQAAPGAVQIPEIIWSVAVAYNIPGIPTKTLKFTGPVLADIFQGKITKWNDPRIKALNPGVNLPNSNSRWIRNNISLRKAHHGIRPLGRPSQFRGQLEWVHQVVKVSQILLKVLLTLLDT